jgi:hypothetical protein
MKMTKCTSCGQYIVFLKTSKGNWMPVDADSVFDIEYEVPDMEPPEYDRLQGHMSHFATCANADKHRKKNSGGG